jgi:two-component system response regulator ResD
MVKKILLVDDDVPTRTALRGLLESEKRSDPFDIHEAGSGSECLKAFDKDGPFSLVLLDVTLPDLDGYEVCKALRSVDPKVPIIFVTARGDLRDFNAGRKAGGDSYLVKPVARQALRATVALFTNLERSRAQGS